MLSQRDIGWLTGLLEGEGCFGIYQNRDRYWQVHLYLQMADRDVVERAARLMGYSRPLRVVPDKRPNRKVQYRFSLSGSPAIGWMMTLYPVMGLRRQGRIRQVIRKWRSLAKRMAA